MYKTKGGQFKYSDRVIKAVYIVRQIFNLSLRQSEGLVRSLLKLLSVNLLTPDYTTISRRVRNLSIDFITSIPKGKINLILDSTGIKVVGEKEWINYKYNIVKQRRIWRKLHIEVTDGGNIVAGEINTLHDSDIATVPALLSQVKNIVDKIVGDGAYYKKRIDNNLLQFENTKDAKFVGDAISNNSIINCFIYLNNPDDDDLINEVLVNQYIGNSTLPARLYLFTKNLCTQVFLKPCRIWRRHRSFGDWRLK